MPEPVCFRTKLMQYGVFWVQYRSEMMNRHVDAGIIFVDANARLFY